MARRKVVTRRASYRDGVAWIAVNDDGDTIDQEDVSGYISTLLLADLFGADPEAVAQDIIRYRMRELRRSA